MGKISSNKGKEMRSVMKAILVLSVFSFLLGAVVGCGQKQSSLNEVVSGLEQEKTINLGSGVTMELVLVPAGSYYMGSFPSEEGRANDEGPVRRVQITRPFYMSKYEVTQGQWKAIMGTTVREQSDGLPLFGTGNDYPIYWVSWDEAVAFCKKLGSGYRLPTEAEWEYACRAGSDTQFHFGDDPNCNCNQTKWSNYVQDNSDTKANGAEQKKPNAFRLRKFQYGDDPNCYLLGQYTWYGDNSFNAEMEWYKYEDDKGRSTHPVGQKKPNAWGLYDMHGNVREWCADWYTHRYRNMTNMDPTGPSNGMKRVIRGGSWSSHPKYCRSAARSYNSPGRGNSELGFRIVLNAE